MFTMNISLPDEMKAFIEDSVAREGYASASEYLCDLIRAAQRRTAKEELETMLADGMRGDPARMTHKDWQTIEREARDGLTGEALPS